MSKKLIVANWKMHFGPAQATKYLQKLANHVKATKDVEVVLCPPFIDLQPMWQRIKNNQFKLGAQNLHYIDEGTFTGEVSGPMLKGICEYAIIGHSERRRYFAESNEVIARKVAASVRSGLTPILCIGENLAERQEQLTNRVLHDQLASDLVMLTAEEVAKIVVTYEPVWSISSGDGHGDIAKPDQIDKALKFIRKSLTQLYGKSTGRSVRILYGGSVNPDFSKDYLKIKSLDGFLVGGASLIYPEFAAIVADAARAAKKPA